jgi:hypothetical protein
LVALGAAPLFWQRASRCLTGCAGTSPYYRGPLSPIPGAGFGITLYWLIAVPIGFVLTVGYYRYRGKRTGVEGRIWPVFVTGLGLLAFLVLSSRETLSWLHLRLLPVWLRIVLFGDVSLRGLSPLIAIAVAVGILASLERSRSLLAFAVAFFVLSLVANLYDMENVLARFGWWVGPDASRLPNVIVPALALLLGGLCFALADRRAVARWARADG